MFSKSDTINWAYILHKITENNNDTIPSYCIDILPERFSEALLKKTKLPLKENKDVVKAFGLYQMKMLLTIRGYTF